MQQTTFHNISNISKLKTHHTYRRRVYNGTQQKKGSFIVSSRYYLCVKDEDDATMPLYLYNVHTYWGWLQLPHSIIIFKKLKKKKIDSTKYSISFMAHFKYNAFESLMILVCAVIEDSGADGSHHWCGGIMNAEILIFNQPFSCELIEMFSLKC